MNDKLIIRSKKGVRKPECANCGLPMEPELVGKQSYCRSCKAEYMIGWRRRKKEEIERALNFYNLHHG